MVNLELYKIFYIVAEEKSITKASEVLNISQPAITKHIKNLEDMLGTPLFTRTKRGVLLNEYGEKIFLDVKQALSILDDVERNINDLNKNNKGTIRIGISTSLTKNYLMEHLKEFHKMYPNIIITIFTDTTKDHIKELKSGKLDLIICKFPKEIDLELNYDLLGKTEYIFACNNEYKELLNRRVNIKELENTPLFLQKKPSNSRLSVDKYFLDNSIKVNPKMNVGSSNLLAEFTKIGYGVSYLTKLYVSKELKNKELFEIDIYPKPEFIGFGIITLKKNILPSYCNIFIKYLRDLKY